MPRSNTGEREKVEWLSLLMILVVGLPSSNVTFRARRSLEAMRKVEFPIETLPILLSRDLPANAVVGNSKKRPSSNVVCLAMHLVSCDRHIKQWLPLSQPTYSRLTAAIETATAFRPILWPVRRDSKMS